MSDPIKQLIAPVIAMLRHDVARPNGTTALNKAYALEQLESVMEILNAPPITSVEVEDPVASVRALMQESFLRKD